MSPKEAREIANGVLENKTRSHVDAARKLAEYVIEFAKASEQVHLDLAREKERLETVIRTGGAMYRAERASMGITGGLELDEL